MHIGGCETASCLRSPKCTAKTYPGWVQFEPGMGADTPVQAVCRQAGYGLCVQALAAAHLSRVTRFASLLLTFATERAKGLLQFSHVWQSRVIIGWKVGQCIRHLWHSGSAYV